MNPCEKVNKLYHKNKKYVLSGLFALSLLYPVKKLNSDDALLTRRIETVEATEELSNKVYMPVVFRSEPIVIPQEVPAFPGAEGFGSTTPGGRGGEVIYVTNLNDSGPGSLRYCAQEKEGPRTCIFARSGTIQLESPLVISNPYLTIAGQTAPGDGICLRDFPLEIKNTHDVQILHLRVRLGSVTEKYKDSLTVIGSQNIIISNCSVTWGLDETLSVVNEKGSNFKTDNVTIQYTIIANSLMYPDHPEYPHAYGSIFGGNMGNGEVSAHHNYWGGHWQRSPRIAGSDEKPGPLVVLVNNVIYNFADGGTESASRNRVNQIGCIHIRGPDTKSNEKCSQVLHGKSVKTDLFLDDTLMVYLDGHIEEGIVNDRVNLVTTPFDMPYITTYTALDAYEIVLDYAGAFPRDSVDNKIINNVRQRSGHLITSATVWPELSSKTPKPDTDGDGMPDEWELLNNLNPYYSGDGKMLTSTGYTNLELYLHALLAGTYSNIEPE